MTEMKTFYEERIRRHETSDFVTWFEDWYGKEEEYGGNECLRDMYLSERRFALIGWLAKEMPHEVRNDKQSFCDKLFLLEGEHEAMVC